MLWACKLDRPAAMDEKLQTLNMLKSSMFLLVLFCGWVYVVTATVSYDGHAIIIDGKRRILISGSIHYPRSTPEVYLFIYFWILIFENIVVSQCILILVFIIVFFNMQMWPGLIQNAKQGGLDVIQTYVFWNGHEPSQGKVIWNQSNEFYFFFFFSCWCILLKHLVVFFENFLSFLQYNFQGRYDLVRFIKLIQQAGLYVHLRIGPFVCAEWNLG